MALCFFIGSAHFMLASFVGLAPALFGELARNLFLINVIYFVGSIFFTVAAYLQLLLAINAGDHVGLEADPSARPHFRWFAWKHRNLGFLASFIQLVQRGKQQFPKTHTSIQQL